MGVGQGGREALKASTQAIPRVASLLGVHWGWGLGGPIHLPSPTEAAAPHLSLVATVPLRDLLRGGGGGGGEMGQGVGPVSEDTRFPGMSRVWLGMDMAEA